MTDWYRILVDLHLCGWTTRRIAEHIGVTEARVRGWRQYGHEPRHRDGEALLSLHRTVLENMRETAGRSVDNREPIQSLERC